jgi:RNA polymerase sigma factor (sigma-70 family)
MKNKTNSGSKCFTVEQFNEIENRGEILGHLPNIELYDFGIKKINKIKSEKINPEMLPCYKSPLLSFEQEQHLFRKMNYFKYKAKKIIESGDVKYKNIKDKIANYAIKKSVEVRNQIAESNFRLATQIMKHKNVINESNTTDAMLSDAYYDVLKAVDYFNWTLGLRFSTYATWVVKKNFFRNIKLKSTNSENVTFIDDGMSEIIEEKGTAEIDKKNHESKQNLINKLIQMLVNENIGTDRVRQASVLEKYFGVNGREKMTLEQISAEYGVTKERVRQLKEKGLEWIREKALELNITMDDASEY